MKKLIALFCTIVLTVGMLGGCSGNVATNEIYVLMPGATHGWTRVALDNAGITAKAINAEGKYKVSVQAATDAKSQQEQLDDLLSRGNVPAGIVILPFDNTLESPVVKLATSDIPFVMYDRIIENAVAQETVISNVKGDNEGIGANVAERFIAAGLKPGEKVYVLVGDTSSVPEQRTRGLIDKLTEQGWTADDMKSIEYSPVTNWNRSQTKQVFSDWINSKTVEQISEYHYFYAHDDEIVMGVLEALASTEIEQQKRDEFCKSVSVFGCAGGQEEIYQVLRGTHKNPQYMEIVKDMDLVSYTYLPTGINVAIQDMIDFLDGKEVIKQHTLPSDGVDASNANEYEGF